MSVPSKKSQAKISWRERLRRKGSHGIRPKNSARDRWIRSNGSDNRDSNRILHIQMVGRCFILQQCLRPVGRAPLPPVRAAETNESDRE